MTAIAATVPFAFTLFTWIHANKKELYASRLPLENLKSTTARHRSEIVDYRDLKNRFAAFETRHRGAQGWLAGIKAPEYFPQNAARDALSLVHHVLENQGNLADTSDESFNSLWKSFLELPGMHAGLFSNLAVRHIGHDRMPPLAAAFENVDVNFTFEHELVLLFTTGAASFRLAKQFVTPTVEGLTLGEQITALNQYWVSIKDYARTELKDAKNWPTEADDKHVGIRRVSHLANDFIKGLHKDDRELLKQHPDTFRAIFNQQF
jgi:hypothetical protein